MYNDKVSSFQKLLDNDNSFTIHERNIQTLAVEIYKVVNGLSPQIMKLVFPLKTNVRYPSENKFVTRKVRTARYGIDTLAHLSHKIWAIIQKRN